MRGLGARGRRGVCDAWRNFSGRLPVASGVGTISTQTLVSTLVVAFVIFRFAMRELRERTVKASSLWLRPGLMGVLTLGFVAATVSQYPAGDLEMIGAVAGGGVLGVLTGMLVVANTRFAPAAIANAVRARGNRYTLLIWIVAFALRFAAHYVLPHATGELAQLPLNCGTFAMTAFAFGTIALAFRREIDRVR